MALRHQPYASADVDCLGRKCCEYHWQLCVYLRQLGYARTRTYGSGSKHPYGAHNMSAYRNRHILFQKRVQRIFPRIPPWENDTPHGSSGQPYVVAGIHADDIRIGLIYICSGDGRMAGRDIACGISDYCHNRYSRFLHLL